MGLQVSPEEMIARLVGFNTVSDRSNLPLIDFVRGYLTDHGIDSVVLPSPDGEKANLYCTIGPQGPGGVVLSGHTDVVPVEGQRWDTDPFQVVEKDAKLFGRGTADMKSFSAIILALVPELKRRALKRPIHLALSYDEEVGCTGVTPMIADMVKNLPPVEAVVVGEPTSMKLINSHKGVAVYQTDVIGRAAHSSQADRGVSAVMTAARLVSLLDDMRNERIARADPDGPFDRNYTSIHVGTIRGGSQFNIVARRCVFEWDVRNIPEDPYEAVLAEFEERAAPILAPLKAAAPEVSAETSVYVSTPALAPEADGAAEALVRQLTGANSAGAVSYGAGAGQFQQAGYSTVICGPGSIDQAHQPNEFITTEQVAAGAAFIRRLADHLAAA